MNPRASLVWWICMLLGMFCVLDGVPNGSFPFFAAGFVILALAER